MMLMMRTHVNPFLLERFLVIRLLGTLPHTKCIPCNGIGCNCADGLNDGDDENIKWIYCSDSTHTELGPGGTGFPFSFVGGHSMDSVLWSFIYRLWKCSKYPLRESSQGVSRSQSVRISKNCWIVTENAAYHTGSLRKWRKRERSEELNNDQQLPTINETKHDRFKGLENAFWIFWRDRHTYAHSNFKILKD